MNSVKIGKKFILIETILIKEEKRGLDEIMATMKFMGIKQKNEL